MAHISKFTPSQTDPAVLESVTVGASRLRLLDDIVSRARQAELGKGRNHTLMSGSRGAGKTHLITLAHHRVGQQTALARSWLHEEGWMTLLGYSDLLGDIVNRVEGADLDAGGSVAELEAALASHAAEHGPVVVFVENFDQVLTALQKKGQQRLRQFMENSRALLFVATTTAMTRDLTQQDSPFYNFFTTTKLERFEVAEAKDMLTRLSHLSSTLNLDELAPELVDARLKAIAHLAGGQPRMWSMFGQAVNTQELDEMVPAFIELVDNLTPYYQQQLERRPTQQRRIVTALARADHPMNVKEIAEVLDLGEKATAAALTDLRDAGWVEHVNSPFAAGLDKRLRYHELCEPLVRAMLQSKDARGDTPIQVIVDFIKHWFDADDLGVDNEADLSPYRSVAIEQLRTDGTIATALQLTGLTESTGVPRVRLLARIDDALSAYQAGDPNLVMKLPTAVRRALEDRSDNTHNTRLELHKWARQEYGDVPHHDMEPWEERASEIVRRSESTEALQSLARWQQAAWEFEAAVTTIARIAQLLGPKNPATLTSRNALANAFRSAGLYDEAITLHQQNLKALTETLGPKHLDSLTSRNNLAYSFYDAGRYDEAITLHQQNLRALVETLGPQHPATLTSRNNLGVALNDAGRYDEALTLHQQNLKDSIEILGPKHPATLTSRNNLALCYSSAGRTNEAITVHQQNLKDSIEILGPKHPATLNSRNNVANAYFAAGRYGEAIMLHEQGVTDRTEILGQRHPGTLTSRHNLAYSYWSIGRLNEAINLYERNLQDRNEVLGPKHPETLSSRYNLTIAYRSAGRNDEADAVEREIEDDNSQ